MFMRGQIGPCPKWMAELDLTKETAAIEEKWIKTGKMLSWYMVPSGFRIIGPKFLGVSEDQGLTLRFYTFPDLERFKEWALGAPEHIALHTKMVSAMKAAVMAAAKAGQPPPPSYSFHAADDPNADIPAIRAELREMYRRIEALERANMPPGSIQVMMLGDHD
jgi:hypothetical protein